MLVIDRDIYGKLREINHIDTWSGDGAIKATATGDSIFNGTEKGTDYGNRDIVQAELDIPSVVPTADENRPYNISAPFLISY